MFYEVKTLKNNPPIHGSMEYKRMQRHFASFPRMTRLVFMGVVLSLFIFGVIFVLSGNGEFVFYSFLSTLFFIFIVSYYHRLRLTETLLLGIVLHWLLSFMGGTLYLGETRLFDLWLFPFLRYDNIIHAFGVFVLTFIAYNLLRPHFKLKNKIALFHFSILLFLIVMGLGALAEIIELSAVLFLDAGDTIGGYLNNAFDLVWNGVGSLCACLLIARHERKTTLKGKNGKK